MSNIKMQNTLCFSNETSVKSAVCIPGTSIKHHSFELSVSRDIYKLVYIRSLKMSFCNCPIIIVEWLR